MATRGFTGAGIRNDRLAALLDVADDALMDEGFVPQASANFEKNYIKHQNAAKRVHSVWLV